MGIRCIVFLWLAIAGCGQQLQTGRDTVLREASDTGEIKPPRIIHKVDPSYPEEARKAKATGTVFLQFIVDVDGLAKYIKVKRSAGYGMDEEAIECLRKWKFEPATKDGTVVPYQLNYEINFRM